MPLSKEDIDIFNNGKVITEYIKNIKHYFCAAVSERLKALKEYDCTSDIRDAFYNLSKDLQAFSKGHAFAHGIKPITETDDLLEYLFSQKNYIPAHVAFWLEFYERCRFGSIADYNTRHFETYNELQKHYINRYRIRKEDAKIDLQIGRENRRRICKLYRDGNFSELFKLSNEDIQNLICNSATEDIEILLSNALKNLKVNGVKLSMAYLIGTLQGKADALKECTSCPTVADMPL